MLVNEEDPLKAQLVDDRISSLVTEANLLISQQVSDRAAGYLDLLVEGRRFDLLGQSIEILGLQKRRAGPRRGSAAELPRAASGPPSSR